MMDFKLQSTITVNPDYYTQQNYLKKKRVFSDKSKLKEFIMKLVLQKVLEVIVQIEEKDEHIMEATRKTKQKIPVSK